MKSSNSVVCMIVASYTVVFILGSLSFGYLLYEESQKISMSAYFETVAPLVFATAFVAFIIATFYGLPCYKLFIRLKIANYYSLGFAGCLPGVFLYIYAPGLFSVFSILFGLFISVLFYWLKMNEFFT